MKNKMKLDYINYYTTTDGNYKYNINVLAFHTMRLQSYREDWTLNEIVVFETLLNRSKRFNHKEFFYQQDRLITETRVKEYSLRKVLEKLKRLNILSVKRKKVKQDRKNYYTINFDHLIKNLDLVYDFNKAPKDEENFYREIFEDFFKYFRNGRFYGYDDLPDEADQLSDTKQKERHLERKRKQGTKAPVKYGIN